MNLPGTLWLTASTSTFSSKLINHSYNKQRGGKKKQQQIIELGHKTWNRNITQMTYSLLTIRLCCKKVKPKRQQIAIESNLLPSEGTGTQFNNDNDIMQT